MMSPYRKNIMVGVVMLGGLTVLAWLLLKFGDAPVRLFSTQRVPVVFVADRAEGISPGSGVLYRGVSVGTIDSIARQSDQQTIHIGAMIDIHPPLPENVVGEIRSTGFIGGGSVISLVLPPDAKPQGQLKSGQTIATRFVGLDLLPPEFAELAKEMRLTALQLRESNVIADMDTAVREATNTIKSLNEVIFDPQVRADLKQSLANINAATATANKIAGNLEKFSEDLEGIGQQTTATLKQTQGTITKVDAHVDDLSKQIDERMVEAAKLLSTFQSIAKKIDDGKGTAGALVNDKRLYEGLVLSSEQINVLLKDLARLVEQWEQEGATIKLK